MLFNYYFFNKTEKRKVLMEKSEMEKEARFKYNLDFEYVTQESFGPKHFSGLAGLFKTRLSAKSAFYGRFTVSKEDDGVLTGDEMSLMIL
jgi:hypothetical protein